ncbi:MAG: hypoxanthine phosphoribosyltransferase [Prosthecobacter sp.]
MAKAVTGLFADLERILLSAEQIQTRVAGMAAELNRVFVGRTVNVVALMDGALFFVADLLRGLQIPVRLHTLSASSYHGGIASSGEVQVDWPLDINFQGQDVLLLDDILDTGLTLSVLREKIHAQRPASLRTAVLLAKKRERVRNVTVEDVGFEIENEFVVGYGMDYQGHFRNLPCIGILNPF